MMKPNYFFPWPCCVPSPRVRFGSQGSCSCGCRANGVDSPSRCSQGSAQPLAVPLSPVPTRKPVSAIYIPRFDLASDMKRHVSQVKGSKQNAATAPHLCLHMIRSLAHTCLAATDPYLPSDFLAVISAFSSRWYPTSRGNFPHLIPYPGRHCGSLAPLSGISPLSRVQPVWEMPSRVLLIASSARDG